MLSFKEGQQTNEGPCIGKEDLREVQGHHPQGSGPGDLRKRKAQAAPGLVGTGISRKLQESRDKGIGNKNEADRISRTSYSLFPNPYSLHLRG